MLENYIYGVTNTYDFMGEFVFLESLRTAIARVRLFPRNHFGRHLYPAVWEEAAAGLEPGKRPLWEAPDQAGEQTELLTPVCVAAGSH